MKVIDVINIIRDNKSLISVIIAVVLTIVQIAPIKLNPWTRIVKWIREIFTGDLPKKVEGLSQEVKSLRAESEEREALNSRIRILRFSDDLIKGATFSKEHYRQIFDEITRYNHYCQTHEMFRNEMTMASVENIRRSYAASIGNGSIDIDRPVGDYYD